MEHDFEGESAPMELPVESDGSQAEPGPTRKEARLRDPEQVSSNADAHEDPHRRPQVLVSSVVPRKSKVRASRQPAASSAARAKHEAHVDARNVKTASFPSETGASGSGSGKSPPKQGRAAPSKPGREGRRGSAPGPPRVAVVALQKQKEESERKAKEEAEAAEAAAAEEARKERRHRRRASQLAATTGSAALGSSAPAALAGTGRVARGAAFRRRWGPEGQPSGWEGHLMRKAAARAKAERKATLAQPRAGHWGGRQVGPLHPAELLSSVDTHPHSHSTGGPGVGPGSPGQRGAGPGSDTSAHQLLPPPWNFDPHVPDKRLPRHTVDGDSMVAIDRFMSPEINHPGGTTSLAHSSPSRSRLHGGNGAAHSGGTYSSPSAKPRFMQSRARRALDPAEARRMHELRFEQLRRDVRAAVAGSPSASSSSPSSKLVAIDAAQSSGKSKKRTQQEEATELSASTAADAEVDDLADGLALGKFAGQLVGVDATKTEDEGPEEDEDEDEEKVEHGSGNKEQEPADVPIYGSGIVMSDDSDEEQEGLVDGPTVGGQYDEDGLTVGAVQAGLYQGGQGDGYSDAVPVADGEQAMRPVHRTGAGWIQRAEEQLREAGVEEEEMRGAGGSAPSQSPKQQEGTLSRALGGQSSPLAKQLRALASGHASMAGSPLSAGGTGRGQQEQDRRSPSRSSSPGQGGKLRSHSPVPVALGTHDRSGSGSGSREHDAAGKGGGTSTSRKGGASGTQWLPSSEQLATKLVQGEHGAPAPAAPAPGEKSFLPQGFAAKKSPDWGKSRDLAMGRRDMLEPLLKRAGSLQGMSAGD